MAIGVTAWLFFGGIAKQSVRTFWDSSAYLEAANQPWSWAQLFYPKPPVVALIYRVIGTDHATIAHVHAGLAFVSWFAVGAALVTAARATAARAAAIVVTAVFMLASHRVGYVDAILSESINDSLMALVLAISIVLTHAADRSRIAAMCALMIVGVLWIFTRDTNAATALVAIAICVAAWWRSLVRDPWAIASVACLTFAATFVLWSTTVVPPPTGLTVQANWNQELTARTTLSITNNILDRVLVDDEARAYFIDHGLPQAEALQRVKDDARYEVIVKPEFVDARQWIAQHGRSVWASWLIRHPIDRAIELAHNGWTLLGVDGGNDMYMPPGWPGHHSFVRKITMSRFIVIALLVFSPLVLWRSRHHRAAFVSLCAIVSGFVSSAVAFFGDTAEPARHCYSCGQQILFGLALAYIAYLDAQSPATTV